jgi:hypothetical protein
MIVTVDELLMLRKLQKLSEFDRLALERCVDNHLRFGRMLAASEDCFDSVQGKARSHSYQDFPLSRRKVFLGKHLVGLIDVTE